MIILYGVPISLCGLRWAKKDRYFYSRHSNNNDWALIQQKIYPRKRGFLDVNLQNNS